MFENAEQRRSEGEVVKEEGGKQHQLRSSKGSCEKQS